MQTNRQLWTKIVLGIAACFAILIFARRQFASIAISTPHHAVVVDSSESFGSRCEDVQRITHQIAENAPASRGSDLAVLLTGDRSTANEPRLLGVVAIPFARRVIEGRRAVARQKEDLEAKVRDLCLESKTTNLSPLFMAAKRGLEHLRGSGCKGPSKCEMYFATDGEENVEARIKHAIEDDAAGFDSLPEPLENDGIDITVCGFSETRGTPVDGHGEKRLTKPHDGRRVDRLRNVWSRLFTQPERVKFMPFCTR